ncbi:MAG: valine--tRNA ligase [Dongiaceae bacterium]
MLDKTYNPAEIEEKFYAAMEKSGAFAAHPESIKPPFTIMMPPPNVTGSLHIGHALTFTLQDVLIRYQRRLGKDALWQPGTDHAGIATQMVVERQLAEQKISRHDLGREKFLEKVWQWKEESGGTITKQLRRLGASADWGRERFTMDEGLSAAVRKAFVELFKAGLIYRAKRLVNWDPKLHTAISDIEVEQRAVQGSLWYFKYPIENSDQFITIATTRPETMLGDVAVAVHPKDSRYKDLVGKFVIMPITGRKIPIIADDYVDQTKGSGAVKITPAHDFNDFEVGKRHKLESINIFDKNAAIIAGPGVPAEYVGMDRFKARAKIVAQIEELGLLEKIEKNSMTVPHGDRSGVVIEPWLTDQWFCDVSTMAARAIKAVEDGDIKFVPEKWANTYYNWMNNIQPWCISRQLWWGHQIPAWFDEQGNYFVALDEKDAVSQAGKKHGKPVKLTRDSDVLDTWFSSALWPFSTLGWPQDTTELRRYYPTDVLVTGFDIIFFWVARMIMMGLHFTNEVPFKTIYMHALVRDAQGQKMSKSKGNVMDPLALIDKFGADALRFTLSALAAPGRDIKLSEDRIAGYRNFATKLWNATRFCEMNGCVFDPKFDPAQVKGTLNRWIIQEVVMMKAEFERAMEEYRFDEAARLLYKTAWNDFCDWYIELSKPVLQAENHPEKLETQNTAAWMLAQLISLLNPLMPFITEELAEKLGTNGGKLLITASWPDYSAIKKDQAAIDEIRWLIELISNIRSVRSDLKIPHTEKLTLLLRGTNAISKQRFATHMNAILRLSNLGKVEEGNASGSGVEIPYQELSMFLVTNNLVDLNEVRAKLNKEIKEVDAEIEKIKVRLSNPDFTAKAPEEVVDEINERREQFLNTKDKLEQALKRLAG